MRREMKKDHKKVIKWMRDFNKHLSHDKYLGIDRFRVDLVSEKWYRFSDGSGGLLFLIFKVTDSVTGNRALFDCDNYDYARKISMYSNDFLIRCSSGQAGHFPVLNYLAYDVHAIHPYAGDIINGRIDENIDSYIVDKYNWTNLKF